MPPASRPSSLQPITFCLSVLATVATALVLWFAQGLFAPLLSALVVGVAFAPAVDRVEKAGLARVFAAFVLLICLALLVALLFVLVEPPLSRAMRNAPLIWRELAGFVQGLRDSVSGLDALRDNISEALNDAPPAAPSETGAVSVPGVADAVAYAPSVAAAIMIFFGTLYFFLVARLEVYAYLGRFSRHLDEAVFCAAEQRVSQYFLTISLINGAFGLLVGIVMAILGMSAPVLWGLAAFLINYVVYLGPAVFFVTLLIAGAMQFDGPMVVVPALAYGALNLTEGQFVTPALVGHHMRVNPLLVFVALVVWLWLWGPIGGIIAIPLLVWSLFMIDAIQGRASAEH